ncbi:unnamed protein product, partial [Rotaria sp. Silwood1]
MGIESVIFEIDVDLTVQRCPFARINKFSDHQDENEILFAIRSIFHIEQVELFTDDIWLVQLILTNEVKKEIEDFLAYFTQHIGYFDEAMEYYKKAIDELAESVGFFHAWFAIVHSNMAMIFDARDELEIALLHYRCALFIVTHMESVD